MKELEDVRYDVSSGIHIQPVNESDLSHLKGTFRGPPGTPYEGGHFVVDIQIPVCIARRMCMAGFFYMVIQSTSCVVWPISILVYNKDPSNRIQGLGVDVEEFAAIVLKLDRMY
jgi:hypothetical protein